jgi:hypothetical protein
LHNCIRAQAASSGIVNIGIWYRYRYRIGIGVGVGVDVNVGEYVTKAVNVRKRKGVTIGR